MNMVPYVITIMNNNLLSTIDGVIERGTDVEMNERESNMYCDGLFVYKGSLTLSTEKETERERERREWAREMGSHGVCV